MKANELRIGNLIDRQDYICKVTKIEEGGIITEPLEYKGERFVEQRVEPIPLTEEWLVKFGFEKLTENAYTYTGGYTFTVFFDGERLSTSFWQGNEKKYVHQLQNLYYALTGEELTIG